MIIITGAAGFIGSCMIGKLNQEKFFDLILVDNFDNPQKTPNWIHKKYTQKIDRNLFFEWLKNNHSQVEMIIHLGARTDTTEFNQTILDELNLNYSKKIWEACVQYGLPLIYASSAATYGMGEQGYNDDERKIPLLKPLNPYGKSKNDFDKWALQQTDKPYFWAGLKFFNVYGPNEYHKARMASVIFHAYHQIKNNGKVNLFKSHNPNFKDGEQIRDFVYVKDVVNVIYFLMNHRKNSGIYNLGSGKGRTFLDLAKSIFSTLKLPVQINFVDTPIDIRDKYQYYTEANMQKLQNIGYQNAFTELEDGINDYINNFLLNQLYF